MHLEDFVSILSDCKNLILLEIYPASEEPIKGYESEDLIKQIKIKNPEAILVNGIEEAYQEMHKFNQDNFILSWPKVDHFLYFGYGKLSEN